ncbi:MAG: hypothetical protein J6J36_07335 [Clostridia bacterium]|nr:hypothetical protein [Clostridia bacterium]
MNKTYNISTQSPMGNLNGILHLFIEKEKLQAIIEFNGKKLNFYNGKFISNNKFRFVGSLKAYFKKINYTAEGSFSDSSIEIIISTNMGNFMLTGTAA